MEQTHVESNKTYYHGFILKEQDLRRIIDLIKEQFKKLPEGLIEYNFLIKFRNGAVANTKEIEAVINLENEGSSSIVRLEITGKHIAEQLVSVIKLDFRNSDYENGFAIKHNITGNNRDWVFVCSSLIEERVGKIKRVSLDQLEQGPYKLLFKLFPLIITFCFFIPLALFMPNTIEKKASEKLKAISTIEQQWREKKINDPTEVLIKIEKSNATIDKADSLNSLTNILSSKAVIGISAVAVLLIFLMVFISRYYPIFNFCWGGYVDIFNKKESTRKVVIGIISGTVFLGIIVNLISSYLWERI